MRGPHHSAPWFRCERTSSLCPLVQVWNLAAEGGAREVGSHYLYESVKSIGVHWASGLAALGSRSGALSLYNITSGKKLQVGGCAAH